MPTPNLGLVQPTINPTYDLWGADMNTNLALIDTASTKLRGTPVSATAPTLGQTLVFNGTSWAPAAAGTGSITGGGAAGQVAFFSSGTAILSDGALRWDNTLKGLGIGAVPQAGYPLVITNTVAPYGHLKLMASPTDYLSMTYTAIDSSKHLYLNGNTGGGYGTYVTGIFFDYGAGTLFASDDGVGIGTILPLERLDIDGGVLVRGPSGFSSNVASSGGMDHAGDDLRIISRGPDGSTNGGFQFLSTAGDGSNITNPLAITSSGIVVGGDLNMNATVPSEFAYHTGLQRIGNDTLFWYGGGVGDLVIKSGVTGGGGDRVMIKQSGNVGFGTVIPSYRVDVVGDVNVTGTFRIGGVSLDLAPKQSLSEKGQPSGYAALDGSGKVPQTQLPAVAITDTFVVADQAARLALTAETGDVAIQQDVATTYILRGSNPAVNADWEQLLFPNTGVQSVTSTAPIQVGGTMINPIVSISAATSSLQGSTRMSVAPASAPDPIAVGDNDPRVANVAHGSGTAGKLPKWSSGTVLTDSLLSESGSVVTATGDLNVTGLYRVGGVQIASTNLSDSASLIKTSTSLGGDLSGSLPNPTVAKINGVGVTGSPTVGQTIVATSGATATWQTPATPAASALKTTGADVTVSAAAPPTAGQVLTATSATTANWQTPSGGSNGGYAVIVVAAASGVPATDTANIQAAINSASTAGGGVVALREGVYLINATLTIANKVTIKGQGKGIFGTGSATLIKCDDAMTNTLPLVNSTTVVDFRLEDLSIDFNSGGRGAGAGTDFTVQGLRFSMSRVAMFNTRSQSGTALNFVSNSIVDQATRTFNQCDFYVGTLTIDWMRASGLFTQCYWEGLTASGGLTNALCNFQSATVIGCRFRTTTDYTGATVTLGSLGGSGAEPSTLSGCIFEQPTGTATRAVRVSSTANVSAAVVGNVATSTSCGSIDIQAGVTAGCTIVGNAGFSAYNNGTQAGNI